MSRASKERNKLKRRKEKLARKAAKKALYLAQSRAGKKKGDHQNKKLDPNRYGKIAEKMRRLAA